MAGYKSYISRIKREYKNRIRGYQSYLTFLKRERDKYKKLYYDIVFRPVSAEVVPEVITTTEIERDKILLGIIKVKRKLIDIIDIEKAYYDWLHHNLSDMDLIQFFDDIIPQLNKIYSKLEIINLIYIFENNERRKGIHTGIKPDYFIISSLALIQKFVIYSNKDEFDIKIYLNLIRYLGD